MVLRLGRYSSHDILLFTTVSSQSLAVRTSFADDRSAFNAANLIYLLDLFLRNAGAQLL